MTEPPFKLPLEVVPSPYRAEAGYVNLEYRAHNEVTWVAEVRSQEYAQFIAAAVNQHAELVREKYTLEHRLREELATRQATDKENDALRAELARSSQCCEHAWVEDLYQCVRCGITRDEAIERAVIRASERPEP